MHLETKLGKIFEKLDSISLTKPMNLARKKFISLFVIGLIQIRDVQFTEVASAMPTDVIQDSNLRRIQDFFANYRLDYRQIAMLLFCFLPQSGRLNLSIDRTNWSFGVLDINFLVITANCKGVGIPLWFDLLPDKSGGNSSTAERMQVLHYCIRLFGGDKLSLTADREFIGEDWLHFLLHNKVLFYIRLKKNTLIANEQVEMNAVKWLGNRKNCFLDGVKLQGHWLSVGMEKLAGNKEDGYLIVVTNGFARHALKAYKSRWSIEVFFQSIKGRGFRMENTHLEDLDRLRKLFALVAIAFALCLTVGIWIDEHWKPIKIKNHGYKANSFFRYGLNHIRDAWRLKQNINEFINIIYNQIHENLTRIKPSEKILM